MELATRPCPACGSRTAPEECGLAEMMFGLGETFGYLTCADCASLYIREVPTDLGAYYSTKYYSFDIDPEVALGRPGVRQLVGLLGRSTLFGSGRVSRAARWLLKEREEFLARTRHEADEIVEQARARAERMVQRTEVVKAAEQRAYEIVDAAEADARRLRHEVEDFCDQKLASFEIVLERTIKMVASGRAKLQGTNLTADIPLDGLVDEDGGYDDEFEGGFDEDDVALADLPPPPGDLFRRDG